MLDVQCETWDVGITLSFGDDIFQPGRNMWDVRCPTWDVGIAVSFGNDFIQPELLTK